MAPETPLVSEPDPELLELTLTLPDGRAGRVRLPVEGLGRSPQDKRRALARKAATWLVVAVVGALISQYVSARFADRQRELEVRGGFITDISKGSVQAYLDAQSAHRIVPGDSIDTGDGVDVGSPADRETAIEQVADAWVLASASITPQMRLYYGKDSAVSQHWDDFQAAIYDWIEIGGAERPDDQQARAERIHAYVTEHVGDPRTDLPVRDPWKVLGISPEIAGDLYQWVGRVLLRGRGALLEDLKAASADVS